MTMFQTQYYSKRDLALDGTFVLLLGLMWIYTKRLSVEELTYGIGVIQGFLAGIALAYVTIVVGKVYVKYANDQN